MAGELKAEIARIVPIVDSYLRDFLRGEPDELYRAAYHLIGAGGKRLRPLMVMEFYRALRPDGDEPGAVPAAAAIELIHNFTLVHDDIMDRDDFRRGVPTVHKAYGEPMAILAGDALFAKAYAALLDSPILRSRPEAFAKAVRAVTDATIKLCEGQALDYELSVGAEFRLEDYYRLIRLKTSSLFVASAQLGVILASADEYVGDAEGYAENLGIAFQIVDDLLGLVGDPSTTGKPVGSDVREGKKTLPIIMALERLPAKEAEALRKLWGRGDAPEEEMLPLVEAIRRSGLEAEVRSLAESYVERSLDHLRKFPDGGARRALEELAYFVVGRNY